MLIALMAAMCLCTGLVEANTCKAKSPVTARGVTVLKADTGYNVTGTITFYQAKEGAPVTVTGVIQG